MKVETNHIKSNVIYTAFLMHGITILAMPAASIMGMIFMARRQRHISDENNVFFNASLFKERMILFTIIGVILATVYLVYVNIKKKYVVSVEFKDHVQELDLCYKTYYNNKIKTVTIPYKNLSVEFGKKSKSKQSNQINPMGGYAINDILEEKVIFYDNKKPVGEIVTGNTFWHKEGGKIKLIVEKLQLIIPSVI